MTPTKFSLSASDVRGRKTNTSYPHRVTIGGVDDLTKVAAYDHASGLFRDHKRKNGEIIKVHRSLQTYIENDCDIFDCDNDPENRFLPDIPPEEWKQPADIDAMFPNVESYTVYSRHHMIEKEGRPARPKFHKYYPRRKPLTNEKQAAAFNQAVRAYCPAFDNNALDPARFIYGVKNPVVEYVPGELTLDEFMEQRQAEQKTQEQKTEKAKIGEVIHAGHRNSTLASAAFTLLKKYGADDGKAFDAFLQTAAKCEPPLDESELKTIWNSALKGYAEKILTDPAYIPPAEYAAQEFAKSLEPTDYTDLGQATVFAAVYGGKVKYTPATKWIVYNGQVWQESELKARAMVQELTDRQLAEARKRIKAARNAYDSAVESGDNDKADEAQKQLAHEEMFRGFVLGQRKSNKIAAVLTEAAPKLEIDVSQLDNDPYLLNTPAGTVDLKTGQMRKHDPADYCTKMTAASPSRDGMDLWLDFLDRLTCSDKEYGTYLQEEAGVCVIGQVMLEKIGIANGKGGNGKSTMFNAQLYTMGDYAGLMSSEILTAQCRKNKSPELAELRGKRLIIAAELEEGMRLDTATVKKLCSTDPIKGEKKYKDPFDFTPSHTVILYTNHLPKVGTLDDGTWDRLIVMPFNARFRGMQGEILNYGNYLFEHAGGAILQWMIDGARRVIANNFHIKEPECVTQAIAAYRENNNWLDAFLKDRCELDRAYTQKSGELYKSYCDYCDNTREYRRSLADFKAALTEAGYNTRKTMNGAIVYGLRVKCRDFQEVDGPTPFDDLPPLTG